MDVMCNNIKWIYLDKGSKFIAVQGNQGYFNFAILDQSDLINIFSWTTFEVEVEAQKKYEDLLEHVCHERHITWTLD